MKSRFCGEKKEWEKRRRRESFSISYHKPIFLPLPLSPPLSVQPREAFRKFLHAPLSPRNIYLLRPTKCTYGVRGPKCRDPTISPLHPGSCLEGNQFRYWPTLCPAIPPLPPSKKTRSPYDRDCPPHETQKSGQSIEFWSKSIKKLSRKDFMGS